MSRSISPAPSTIPDPLPPASTAPSSPGRSLMGSQLFGSVDFDLSSLSHYQTSLLSPLQKSFLIHQISQTLSQANSSLSSTRDQLSNVQAKLASAESELSEVKAEKEDLESKLNGLKTELETKRVDAKLTNVLLEETRDNLGKRESELTMLKENHEEVKSELDGCNRELRKLKQELEETWSNLKQKESDLLKSKEENISFRNQVRDTGEKDAKIMELTEEVSQLQAELHRTKRDLKVLKEDHRPTKSDLEKVLSEVQQVKSEVMKVGSVGKVEEEVEYLRTDVKNTLELLVKTVLESSVTGNRTPANPLAISLPDIRIPNNQQLELFKPFDPLNNQKIEINLKGLAPLEILLFNHSQPFACSAMVDVVQKTQDFDFRLNERGFRIVDNLRLQVIIENDMTASVSGLVPLEEWQLCLVGSFISSYNCNYCMAASIELIRDIPSIPHPNKKGNKMVIPIGKVLSATDKLDFLQGLGGETIKALVSAKQED